MASDHGPVNAALRDHVTSAAFVLTLGKTHVAELVRLDLELAAEVYIDYRRLGKLHRTDMSARQGLAARGLIVNVFDERKWGIQGKRRKDYIDMVASGTFPPAETWHMTRAGRLVCDLLKEAGLYQEHAGALLPLIEEAKRGRRRSA